MLWSKVWNKPDETGLDPLTIDYRGIVMSKYEADRPGGPRGIEDGDEAVLRLFHGVRQGAQYPGLPCLPGTSGATGILNKKL